MISEDRQMILKVKALSEEEKKMIADRLEEWTITRIERNATKTLSIGDIHLSDISAQEDYTQMDELYLYYYLLGLPLYLKKRTPEEREKFDSKIYGEVQVRNYTCNGKPFTLLCLVTDEEFNELYKDIVIEE